MILDHTTGIYAQLSTVVTLDAWTWTQQGPLPRHFCVLTAQTYVDGARKAQTLVDGMKTAQAMVDGARKTQTLTDGAVEGESLIDGAVKAQARCNR